MYPLLSNSGIKLQIQNENQLGSNNHLLRMFKFQIPSNASCNGISKLYHRIHKRTNVLSKNTQISISFLSMSGISFHGRIERKSFMKAGRRWL